MIKKASTACELLMKTTLALLSATTLSVAVWGVFSRNVLNSSVVWADTIATWLFVWTVMLGSAYAVARGGHMEIGIGKDSLPPMAYKLVTIVGFVAVASAAVFLTYAGWRFVEVSGDTPSPAVGVTQKWVLLAFPVGGVAMVLAALERLLHAVITPATDLKATAENIDSIENEVV